MAFVINAEQRATWDHALANYGSGWDGGVGALERMFHVAAGRCGRGYQLDLVMRAPPGIAVTLELDASRSGLTYAPASLPDAPPLTDAERARVDAALRTQGTAWLLEPGERCVSRDLADGIVALVPEVAVTRRIDTGALQWAALYGPDKFGRARQCAWIDMATGALGGVAWYSLPVRRGGRLMTAQEVSFIDTAMRTHGSFGVYGDVTCGLAALTTSMEVTLTKTDASWRVSADPPDNHGHYLRFEIARPAGTIDGCLAGHYVPMPEPPAPPSLQDPELARDDDS